jgi:acyl carrier protein
VAAIWSEILAITAVGVRENFFDVGGHSLLLMRVHTRLREEFQTEIPVVDLFRYTTVEDLAAYLDRRSVALVAGGGTS